MNTYVIPCVHEGAHRSSIDPLFTIVGRCQKDMSLRRPNLIRVARIFLAATLGLIGTLNGLNAFAHGRLVNYPNFESQFVTPRDVTVWLPDGYSDKGPRLPVVYMQDGENLFDALHSLSGVSWGVPDTVSRLIREHKIPPVIIVGIASTAARGREYLPQRIYDLLPDATRMLIRQSWGGPPESDQYLKFLVYELKPFIDATYRTQWDRPGTYIMGSSMGGLVAFYAQMEYPDVFGGSASLSMHWLLGNQYDPLPAPSVLNRQVLRAFETYVSLSDVSPGRHMVYIDRGTETLDARYVPYTAPFALFMRRAGWRSGKEFENRVYPGADHSEKSWRARLAMPLRFLLAPLLNPGSPARREVRDDGKRLAQVRDARSPAEYLISKFETADVVLLGEDHAIKQDLDFIANLVPRLYAGGVTNLVMEFGAAEDQAALDRLVTSPAYDAAAAKRLMFDYNVMWSWAEYRNIYKAVWSFNHRLPAGKPPFRIINMSYVYDWSGFSGIRTPTTMSRVFWRGAVEQFRADVISREVLDRGEKALVLTGTIHAFTRFSIPQTQNDADGFCEPTANALGNRLFRTYGTRVANVMFHQSLPALPGQSRAFEQPGGGAVEQIMHLNGNRSVGFDLRGAPMGSIPDRSYYALCERDLTLGDLFDGYVFLVPFSVARAATPDLSFIDQTNIDQVVTQFPDPDWSTRPSTVAQARADLVEMARRINARYAALARHF